VGWRGAYGADIIEIWACEWHRLVRVQLLWWRGVWNGLGWGMFTDLEGVHGLGQ